MDILKNTTFIKCRNLVSKPVEINFTDGKGSQRIAPLTSVFYIDEGRLNRDELATAQLENHVKAKKIRILARGVEL